MTRLSSVIFFLLTAGLLVLKPILSYVGREIDDNCLANWIWRKQINKCGVVLNEFIEEKGTGDHPIDFDRYLIGFDFWGS